jgi:glycerophosphoryl diester phosphodiesterase
VFCAPLRISSVVASTLLALATAAHAACPPGRFLLKGQPLVGLLAGGVDAIVVAPGATVSIASGCEAVAAEVRDTRRGARIVVEWPRCGAREQIQLRARLSGKGCGRIRGALRIAGDRRHRVRGKRTACAATDLRCRRFTNIAHRGGAGLRPENTLAAFANAVELGADVLEMDVHATADGVVVLSHDPRVDRTTDGTGAIAAMSFAEVRALDAGYRFTTDRGATFPYRGQGVRIPTLEEVLTTFPAMPVSIEIKQYAPSIVGSVLDVVSRADAAGRAVVVAFDQGTMDAVRAAAPPGLLTGMSLAEMGALGALDDASEAAYVPPAPVAQLPFQSVTPALMARAERHGIVVQVWTVNRADDMQRMLALGVHGVMTNDPATLADLLAAAGGRRASAGVEDGLGFRMRGIHSRTRDSSACHE